MVTIDCADPRQEGAFWSAVLGWDLVYDDGTCAMLQGPTQALGFGRQDGYEAPGWPNDNGTKQSHLDLAVDDIPAVEARCLELGATLPAPQPAEAEGGTWRVLLDPAGHPFCLTEAKNWS